MEARLIYSVNGIDLELERMPLEMLDFFTYQNFKTEEEILESPRYNDLLNCLSRDGQLKVVYDGYDIPIDVVDHLLAVDGDPYNREQTLSVLTRDRKIQPIKGVFKRCIAGTLADKKVVDEFYNRFREMLTPKERLFYCFGMLNEDDRYVFPGINRVINEAMDRDSGYLTGRILLDGISRFPEVENKDSKGRICSPCLVKKK